MSLLTVKVDREGTTADSTYGMMTISIPADTWSIIQNRKLMVSDMRSQYFAKYPSLRAGSVSVNTKTTLKDCCTVNSDGSAYFVCYTLEDIPRDVKVFGKTCIPAGMYELTLIVSGKFGKGCPAINNVPGFDGIRIHAGTSKDWTEGCVLVGMERTNNNNRMSSCRTAEIIVWNLLANLKNVGHTLQIDIRFNNPEDKREPVQTEPTTEQKASVVNGMKKLMRASRTPDNFVSIGEAGDCGCYSLSSLDPDTKGEYPTQNTKKFFSNISENIYDMVKNKKSVNSFTNGTATTGVTVTPIVMDNTNYSYNVPTKDSLQECIEKRTHGKKLDIVAKGDSVASSVFEISYSRTVVYEGGYIFDPIDTARERKYGLSFAHDGEELRSLNVTNIKDLEEHDAVSIYRTKYWYSYSLDVIGLQELADLVFDTLVCCGTENGLEIVKKTIRDNYGVSAPKNTSWEEFLKVMNYESGPKLVNEIVVARKKFHSEFVEKNRSSEKFLEKWLERCDDYTMAIEQPEKGTGNGDYFVNIFKAVDDWLNDGSADTGITEKGLHFVYNNSIQVTSYIPVYVSEKPKFIGFVNWGMVCQRRINMKTDWSVDGEALQEQQWAIVSECLEMALNSNIIPVTVVSGVSPSGQFFGNITSHLFWASL